jgi:hypothetical protein
MIPVGEKAVVHNLHRDGAEPFPHAERPDVSNERTEEAAPVQAVVALEPPILRCDEGLLDVLRHIPERNVHPAHDRQPADQPAVLIDDASAFTGVKGTNLGGGWAASEAASEHPRVADEHSGDRRAENREADPMTTKQGTKREARRLAPALPKCRYREAWRESHGGGVRRSMGVDHEIGTAHSVAGFRPLD